MKLTHFTFAEPRNMAGLKVTKGMGVEGTFIVLTDGAATKVVTPKGEFTGSDFVRGDNGRINELQFIVASLIVRHGYPR